MLNHTGSFEASISVEVDVDGTGVWLPYQTFKVNEKPLQHVFPEGFGAYWIRFTTDIAVTATAQLTYE
jgi:hypothetical protein